MAREFQIMKATKEELSGRMISYLNSCAETATIPSCKGFAKSIGYSDSHLRRIRLDKPNSFQGELLEMFADTVCDILSQGGLKEIINPKMAMFRANPHLTMRARKGEEGYGQYLKIGGIADGISKSRARGV